MRADARHNKDRLLAVAHAAFTERGTDASLKEIAHRTGVGVGTLYRHFPTREALLEALLRDRFDELTARARHLLESAPPRPALVEWAQAFMEVTATYRGVVTALTTTLRDESSDLHAACLTMRTTATRLLTRAQEAGQVRPDLDPVEFFILISGITWASEQASPAPGRDARLLTLLLEGLDPR